MRIDRWTSRWGLFLVAVAATAVSAPRVAIAHCDGLDGPVVTAARRALETGDVSRALIWVRASDEPEIRNAFQSTMKVRRLSRPAAELADRFFFETLVRVHRAGEGAAFTGLQPAGRDLGPAIPAADRALESGEVEPLVKLILQSAEEGVRRRFAEARDARGFSVGDVDAGRRYVGSYVSFIHYVEGLYEAASTSPVGHGSEEEAAISHPH